MNSYDIVQSLWAQGGMPAPALAGLHLSGHDPVLPSSFAVGMAAQSSIAAAALAAAELGHARGTPRQDIGVDMQAAAMECTGWFSINGQVLNAWEKFSGLYPCADGWVRIHANFAHHRDGALDVLGLSAETAEKADVRAALANWRAQDFEQAASERGMVVAAMRSFDEWDQHPQAAAIAAQPLFSIERIGDAAPRGLPALASDQRPLTDVRVLDLTRIIAGPVGGRTLAAYGADVMMVNAPHLPNIDSIMDMSRGKLSCLLDLRQQQAAMDALLADAHVLVQGYRPGGVADLGYGPAQLAEKRPGIIAITLSAYGAAGPWANKRGFDSLVQTATGFNHAEAQAFGSTEPKAMPVQILDFATGFLIAYLASVGLYRQMQEGGSWHIQVSLAQTAHWLRHLPRFAPGLDLAMPDRTPLLEGSDCGYGQLLAMRHSAQFGRTPAGFARPSMPPGSHAPVWPQAS